jgi:hypothetical protein
LTAAQALKRGLMAQQERSARYWGNRIIALWVAIARVNFYIFKDDIEVPKSLHTLMHYIAEERNLLLEIGQLVAGYENATPNFHVGMHLPEQIYLCTSPYYFCYLRLDGTASVFSTSLYEMVHQVYLFKDDTDVRF